jgi:hypothetical protein
VSIVEPIVGTDSFVRHVSCGAGAAPFLERFNSTLDMMRPTIPKDYLGYVRGEGVDAGTTRGDPGYFQLWALDDVVGMNESYNVDENAPGFVGFGSDGGGEMLAFDGSGAVFMMPFVGMSIGDARRIASSWSEIATRITVEKKV